MGILLLLIFTTCKNFAPDSHDDSNRVIYTNVEYSPDGSSVTIYLDGTTVPVTNRQSRALGKEMVIAGHDFFEVAFYSHVDAKTVRTSWELMKNAYVSGLTRDVDYQYLNVADATANNAGAAILFAGKKTDRTLLGIGRLKSTDTGGTTIISKIEGVTPGTKSITFEVAALECGVSNNAAISSFFTNYNNPSKTTGFLATDTERTHADIGGIEGGFEKYKLLNGSVTAGEYTFRTAGAIIDNYLDGIILAGSAEYMKKQPRYPKPGGGFQYYSLRLDDKTKITPVNNNPANPANVAFQNPLRMLFDTRGENDSDGADDTVEGSVFALVFQVPVYPLSDVASPGKWYIRASYDSYWLDLDDSKGGAGGAVFMGMGEPTGTSNYRIIWVQKPYKYKYPSNEINYEGSPNYPISSLPSPHNTHTGRVFCTHNIKIAMATRAEPPVILRVLDPNELTYKLGGAEIRDGDLISDVLYGLQSVLVEFENPLNGYIVDTLSYPIVCNGDGRNYADIPINHVIDYSSYDDNFWRNGFPSLAQTGGTWVIVFSQNVDMIRMLINYNNNPYLAILVSREEGVIVGRAPDTYPDDCGVFSNTISNANNATHSYLFSTWPFDDVDPLRVAINDTGTLWTSVQVTNPTTIQTHPYTLNAGGSYSDFTPPAVAPPGSVRPIPAGSISYFIHGHVGRFYNVTVETGTGMVIMNRDWLR